MTPRRISLGTVDITEREVQLVTDCLRSGHISPGQLQKKFEDMVAGYHGKKHATFVNSGQSALHLSLEVLKRKADLPFLRVLCPAVTYISTLHAIWNAQCDVTLCDVDDVNFMLNPAGIGRRHFDVAMPVDLFGKPWHGIRLGVPCIEDACEAVGAEGVGYGDIVCMSFYASHSITTGVGGMVLTNDREIDDTIKRLANHGRTRPDAIYTKTDAGYDMSRQFVFTDEGYSFKNSDLNAALGIGQMERLHEITGKRRQNGLTLISRLRHLKDLRFADPSHHTFQMFPVICRTEKQKCNLVAHLNKQGIETRDAMPITTQPVVIERLEVKPGMYPVADMVAKQGFYIGCHQHTTDDDLEYIVAAFESFFGEH